VPEPLIERDEIVGLLFNVSDIAVVMQRLGRLLEGGGDETAEDDEG
jgi:hypothetical protein